VNYLLKYKNKKNMTTETELQETVDYLEKRVDLLEAICEKVLTVLSELESVDKETVGELYKLQIKL
jgi:3-dehydroquinate dehydratase